MEHNGEGESAYLHGIDGSNGMIILHSFYGFVHQIIDCLLVVEENSKLASDGSNDKEISYSEKSGLWGCFIFQSSEVELQNKDSL